MDPKYGPGKPEPIAPGRRRPGRPRMFQNPTCIKLRMDTSLHDRVIIEALRQKKDVCALIRELLDQGLNRRPS